MVVYFPAWKSKAKHCEDVLDAICLTVYEDLYTGLHMCVKGKTRLTGMIASLRVLHTRKEKRYTLLRSTHLFLLPLSLLSFLPLGSLLFLLPFHPLPFLLLRSPLFLFGLTCILGFKTKRDFRLADSQ
jgi:hypothetical protein